MGERVGFDARAGPTVIDAHCHVDLYPSPAEIAAEAERHRVFTIAVTNLPSAFEAAFPHTRGYRYLRLALGMHPLHAEQHAAEWPAFARCLSRTSYVGEVGLDYSRDGLATRDLQVETFRALLRLLRERPRFISVHSRRAESAVLDLLDEVGVGPVVFHWYSGPFRELDRLIAAGHSCSVNPAMVRSRHGRRVIGRLPPDRVLTETDGPFVAVGGRPARPPDIADVEEFLARQWLTSAEGVRTRVRENLRAAIPAREAPHVVDGG